MGKYATTAGTRLDQSATCTVLMTPYLRSKVRCILSGPGVPFNPKCKHLLSAHPMQPSTQEKQARVITGIVRGDERKECTSRQLRDAFHDGLAFRILL